MTASIINQQYQNTENVVREMSEILRSKIRCVNCQQENDFEFKRLKKRKFVKCAKCGAQFNLFGIWHSLYRTNPLCQRLVDVSTRHTDTEYIVSSKKENETRIIKEVLENNDFESMKARIFNDLVLYGDSFILMKNTGADLALQRLEPPQLSFKVDFVQEPPFRSYSEKIVEISEFGNPTVKYNSKCFLHYKVQDLGYEPFGFPILVMWFHDWYFLGDLEETIPLLSNKISQEVMLKKYWEYRESAVIRASNVPEELVFPWIQGRVRDFRWFMFEQSIERRRKEISIVTNEEMFPLILKRPFNRDNFPNLKFDMLDVR